MKGNSMMKRIFLIPAIAFGVLAANAAPLKRADVAADPSMLVHIDFDGLRATSVGKAILTQLSQPDVDTKLSAIKGIFSFDPRTQLHGVTLYTKGKTAEGGVLIVYADFDSNRVLNLGMLAPGFHTITNGSHVIYSWIDEKKKDKGDDDDGPPHIYAAIRDNRVILGKSESWLISELNVLDGSEPSLAADNSSSALGEAGNGVFVQAVVRKFDFGGDSPNAAIFKMSKLARLEVGEKDDQLSATLKLTAADNDTATQISAIAQGLLALLKLQKGNPDATKLVNALSLRQDGANVIATASIPSQEAADLIKAKVCDAQHKHSDDTNSSPSQ
ncbi:MAG TPA: hypothetical protein VGN61_00600 [Verrucomicrobiae bacterium]